MYCLSLCLVAGKSSKLFSMVILYEQTRFCTVIRLGTIAIHCLALEVYLCGRNARATHLILVSVRTHLNEGLKGQNYFEAGHGVGPLMSTIKNHSHTLQFSIQFFQIMLITETDPRHFMLFVSTFLKASPISNLIL